MRVLCALLVPCLLLPVAASGQAQAPQLDLPRLSPKANVSQAVGLTDVSIAYSRPSVRGRAIWGALVPYGEVWRTGANEATTITVSGPFTIGGKQLPAGTYGLFTVPGKESWTVVVNSGAKLWGAYEYKQADDLVRFPVTPRKAASFTETMTFSFPVVGMEDAEIALAWEEVEIRIPLHVETVKPVLEKARAAVGQAAADDWRTPLRAASFALDNKVALDEAARWLDRSIEARPGYYNVFAKARLAAERGEKAEAVRLARRAIELGKAAQPPADTAPAERAIEEWQGGRK